MDIRFVLRTLLPKFKASRIRHALIGGVAFGFHAAPRATADVDVLVHHDDLDTLGGLRLARLAAKLKRDSER